MPPFALPAALELDDRDILSIHKGRVFDADRILAGEELTDEDEYLNSAAWDAGLHTLEVRQEMLHNHRAAAGHPSAADTPWDTAYHLSRMVHEANPDGAEKNTQVKTTKKLVPVMTPSSCKPKAVTRAAVEKGAKKPLPKFIQQAVHEDEDQEEGDEEDDEEEWEEVVVRQRRGKANDSSSSPLKNKGTKTNTARRPEPKATASSTTIKPKPTGKAKSTLETTASNNGNGQSNRTTSAVKKPLIKKAPTNGKKATVSHGSSDEEEAEEVPAPAKKIVRRCRDPTPSDEEEGELGILARTPATKRRRVVAATTTGKGKSTATNKSTAGNRAPKSAPRANIITPKTTGKKNVQKGKKPVYAQDSDVADEDDDE